MVNTFFSGILKGYRRAVCALEAEVNPRFASFNAVESLSSSSAKALLIYSDNDTLCKRKHYDILSRELAGKDNVDVMLVTGKGHNPNYTADAVGYLSEFIKMRSKLLKRRGLTDDECAEFVSSFDFDRMTEQDMDVWEKIFEHLDS